MQIKVTYNKTTKEIAISNDIEDIVPMELNTNSVIDTDTEVSFEIAVNTSTYEMIQSEVVPPEEIIE
jgi:hypothetical protein